MTAANARIHFDPWGKESQDADDWGSTPEELRTRYQAPEPPDVAADQPPDDLYAPNEGGHRLRFHTINQLRARAAQRGRRTWLVRGWIPHGTYGVHGAEPKAQKSWNAHDLAVSVASGTPWLGQLPIDTTGPALIFAGEGGETSVLRRIEAIATSRGLDAGDLRIAVCARAPHLNDTGHMESFREALEHHQPALVVLDPLYLAARGGKLGDLYGMGALLERPQHLCQDANASLFVVTHHNRSEGRGSHRMTGAGPAEWGRFLISGTVISRHREPHTHATRVLTELDLLGGEVAEATLRVNRRIEADNPDDLDSPLSYEVTAEDVDTEATAPSSDMPPARAKLLAALRAADNARTGKQLVDAIAEKHGHGLKRETVSRHLQALLDLQLVDCLNPDARPGEEKQWIATTPTTP